MNITVEDGKFVGKYPFHWDDSFWCNGGDLISLEGAPTSVAGDFYCENNHLTSLKGAPTSVYSRFHCYNNHLTSLEGAPKEIDGGFWCQENLLTSIQNINHHIKKIGGSFWSDDNLTGLISLLMIEHPPTNVYIGPLSDIFNDALDKIHSKQDRMEIIMEVILNTPEVHSWQLGDIE